jgi:single-strand DNA-binding protein
MNSIRVQLAGHLGSVPELKYTESGQAVAKLSVAVTERFQRNGQWIDGATTWSTVYVWGQAAENVTASLVKGTRVIVIGRLRSRTYEVDGEARTVWEVTADEIGPSLDRVTATIQRTTPPGAGE